MKSGFAVILTGLLLLFSSASCPAQSGCTPPIITVPPQGDEIYPGDIVTLTVAATGTAPLSFAWFLLSNGGSAALVGQNTPQFTTPPLAGSTAYYVKVSNACGSASSLPAVLDFPGVILSPRTYQIANSASLYLSGQNGLGIAQGSLFVVSGQFLSGARQQATSFPLPLLLGGTSVQIQSASVTLQAPLIATSFSGVTALLPSSVPLGHGMLTVTSRGMTGWALPIHVVKSAYGAFTATGNGIGSGMITESSGRFPSLQQPGRPGDTVVLWGTGLGAVAGDEAAGPLPGNSFTPEVFVGNAKAIVQYAGRSGCCAGIDQIAFQIPPAVQGCFVPVVVRSGGIVSNFVSLPVGPPGQPCSDPVGLPAELIVKADSQHGLDIGIIAMGPVPTLQGAGFAFSNGLAERLSISSGTRLTAEDLQVLSRGVRGHRGRAWRALVKKLAPVLRGRNTIADLATMAHVLDFQGITAGFWSAKDPVGFASEILDGLPPPGTCTVGHNWGVRSQSWDVGADNTALDAGPRLLFTGPNGTLPLPRLPSGDYQLPLNTSAGLALAPGTYTISSNGGQQIGPFAANLEVGSRVSWTNKENVAFIDRSEPLTIYWSGGPATGWIVFGGSASTDGVQAAFACVENIANQSLTVPDYVLAAMPHSSSDHGSLFLTMHPLQNQFAAPGIDIGFFADLSADSKAIGYQ